MTFKIEIIMTDTNPISDIGCIRPLINSVLKLLLEYDDLEFIFFLCQKRNKCINKFLLM